MIASLRKIKISTGVGENYYTMNRGSFRYRERIRKKTALTPHRRKRTPEGFRAVYRVNGEKFVFDVTEQDGIIRAALIPPERTRFNRYRITFPVEEGLHFYGCGEIHAAFDLAGRKVRIFVAEHQNTNRIGKKLIRKGLRLPSADEPRPFGEYESYYAQPTFTTSGRWFFHAETKGFSEFDFTVPGQVTFRTQEPPVFYIGRAETFEALSEKLTGLLGRQRLLPDWAHDGAILAIQGGTEEVERKLDAALSAGAKVCGIWSQDWCGCRRTGFGYQVMWNWEWDRELYPGLDQKIPEWRERGVHFLGYINPFIALEKDLYRTASERGYCVKDKNGKDYLVTITTFPAAMVDLTNPEAREWYKSIIKENMIGLGLDGWMADFGEYLPVDCVLYSGEDPYMVHNSWPAMWAELNAEAIRETGKEDEVFFFTRAGYTGTPRFSPMMWTGDHHVDWSRDDGIGSVIPATLSLAMSGFGITHADVGGYTTVSEMTRSRELLLRWEELGAFSPLYRFHEGNQPARNVQFDADNVLLAQLARMSYLYTSLKPYLKELEAENTARGIPVMRPLFYHYDEEAAYEESTEYLLGRDVLISPVLWRGESSREVYLPEDAWVHIFTGREYHGGHFRVEAPIGQPPVFVRKESRFAEIILKAGGKT